MIGVNGWYSANQRRTSGNEPVGTKPLPSNGSTIGNRGRLAGQERWIVMSPMLVRA